MSNNIKKSNNVKLLDPANSKYRGQEKVNAEIFTALEILGRKLERTEGKLERTEAERDRLADRLEMLESAATLDEETGKIYLPAVINDKRGLASSKVSPGFLTFTSTISSFCAIAALVVVLAQNPNFVLSQIVSLKALYKDASLTAAEKVVMVDDAESLAIEDDVVVDIATADNFNELEPSTNDATEEVVDSKEFEQVLNENTIDETVKEVKAVPAVKSPEPVVVKHVEETKPEKIEIVSESKSEQSKKKDELVKKDKAQLKEKEVAVSDKADDKSEKISYVEYDMPADGDLTGDVKDLEKAAYSGVPEAQHDLGVYYAEGQVVKRDYKRAVYWLGKASDNGIGNASYNLAVMYQQGLPGNKDFDKAMKYYRRAVDLGHPEAMYNLGIIYFGGNGVKRDIAKGVGYFKKAAEEGVVEAAYNLGVLYESDLLGDMDMKTSMHWYKKAANQGYKKAEDALVRLANLGDFGDTLTKSEKTQGPVPLVKQ